MGVVGGYLKHTVKPVTRTPMARLPYLGTWFLSLGNSSDSAKKANI